MKPVVDVAWAVDEIAVVPSLGGVAGGCVPIGGGNTTGPIGPGCGGGGVPVVASCTWNSPETAPISPVLED